MSHDVDKIRSMLKPLHIFLDLDMPEIASDSHSNANEQIEDILSSVRNDEDLYSYFFKEDGKVFSYFP